MTLYGATLSSPSQAQIHAAARARGYAGVLSWAWTCLPNVDSACVSHDELARGLRAAAASTGPAAGPLRGETRGARSAEWLPLFSFSEERAALEQQRARVTQKNYVCSCGSNRSPDSRYTCSEQAMWGKCEESWMKSHCLGWCHNCGQPLAGDRSNGDARASPTEEMERGWPTASKLAPILALAIACALALTGILTGTLALTLLGVLGGPARGAPLVSQGM